MQLQIQKIKNSLLFKDINENELDSLLHCLKPMVKSYEKDSIILAEGDSVNSIGVVMSGKVQIIKEDFYGNRNILTEIGEHELFAETFPFVKVEKLPVTVTAQTDCEIMFINHKAITTGCSSACGFHTKLIENLLYIIARKNLVLNKKIEHMSERTTREKLLSFLFSQEKEANAKEFDIPFDRQALADYLCVERSAMSGELSKLRKEGILDFNKNHFKIM